MSATPIVTRTKVLEIKYGNTMSVKPQTSGTIALCFLPYTKKPNPTEPNNNPQSSHDSFNAAAPVA